MENIKNEIKKDIINYKKINSKILEETYEKAKEDADLMNEILSENLINKNIENLEKKASYFETIIKYRIIDEVRDTIKWKNSEKDKKKEKNNNKDNNSTKSKTS